MSVRCCERATAQVGKGKVVYGLSGCVDSGVVAVPLHERSAISCNVCFKDKGEQVVRLFRDYYNIPLVHADASKQFLDARRRHDRPREERKTIGALFIDVFEAAAKKIGGAQFLAQRTLYPDVIESDSFTGGPS